MIEAKLYKCLSNDVEIKSLVGTKIFPILAKEGTEGVYITYQIINDKDLTSVQGDSYYNKTRIQIDVYSKNYSEVARVTGAVKNALYGLNETIYDLSSSDVPPEADTRLYRRLIEFYINN